LKKEWRKETTDVIASDVWKKWRKKTTPWFMRAGRVGACRRVRMWWVKKQWFSVETFSFV
jgi:hypothetical protein